MTEFKEVSKDCPWKKGPYCRPEVRSGYPIRCEEENCAVVFWIQRTERILPEDHCIHCNKPFPFLYTHCPHCHKRQV